MASAAARAGTRSRLGTTAPPPSPRDHRARDVVPEHGTTPPEGEPPGVRQPRHDVPDPAVHTRGPHPEEDLNGTGAGRGTCARRTTSGGP